MPGRAPRPPADRKPADELRQERRARALEEPLDVRPRPDPRFVRLEVRNPVRQTRYDVVVPCFPDREGEFCTCADFAHRDAGTCKHLEAAVNWISQHPGELATPADPVPTDEEGWAAIDRQLRAQSKSRASLPVRYRIGGLALVAA